MELNFSEHKDVHTSYTNYKEVLLLKYTKWLASTYHIESLIDNENYAVNDYLSDEKHVVFEESFINTIHEINEIYMGNVVFCGSFGLVLNGLLKREIHDIDVLTFENYYDDITKERKQGSSGIYFVGGIQVFCFKEIINNITVDIMYRGTDIEYNVQNFYGKDIKVEKPLSAIQAKKQYLESNKDRIYKEKHEKDLLEIQRSWNIFYN